MHSFCNGFIQSRIDTVPVVPREATLLRCVAAVAARAETSDGIRTTPGRSLRDDAAVRNPNAHDKRRPPSLAATRVRAERHDHPHGVPHDAGGAAEPRAAVPRRAVGRAVDVARSAAARNRFARGRSRTMPAAARGDPLSGRACRWPGNCRSRGTETGGGREGGSSKAPRTISLRLRRRRDRSRDRGAAADGPGRRRGRSKARGAAADDRGPGRRRGRSGARGAAADDPGPGTPRAVQGPGAPPRTVRGDGAADRRRPQVCALFVDFEGTSEKAAVSNIVQIAAVCAEGDACFTALVACDEVPRDAVRLHGISAAYLLDERAEPFAEVWSRFADWTRAVCAGRPLVLVARRSRAVSSRRPAV